MSAKYEIGQLVTAHLGDGIYSGRVEYIGKVEGYDYEYHIKDIEATPDDFPLLAWEYEVSPVNAPEVLEEERSDDE